MALVARAAFAFDAMAYWSESAWDIFDAHQPSAEVESEALDKQGKAENGQ
jgi:hypothetical protein